MMVYLYTFLTAFVLTFLAIPSIINVAKIKHLFDEPDERKVHKSKTPTLGGLAIFAGLIFAISFWREEESIKQIQYIVSGILILSFMGIKDDIVPMTAYKKLVGQILAASIVIVMGNIKINNFHGIFGIYEVPYLVSIAVTIFTFVVVINAINLIDGIDGLAGGIGLIATFFFAYIFDASNSYNDVVLALGLAGSLAAFLYYNFQPAKIFMGDTGSLIVGFVLAILATKFISNDVYLNNELLTTSKPVIAIAVLIIPLFDTLRVFIVRVLKKRSPFSPDRNHIHHCMLDAGFSHARSSILFYATNIFFIITALLLRNIEVNILLLIIIALAFVMSQIPFYLKHQLRRKQNLK